MAKCISCNTETSHSICDACAGKLVSKMNRKDLIAHALVGMDVMDGKSDLVERLEKYKAELKGLKL